MTTMRKTMAAAGSVAHFALQPGLVAGLVGGAPDLPDCGSL
jgi:hypothetical protein